MVSSKNAHLRTLKRFLDVTGALLILILLPLPFLVIALLIFILEGWPIVYKSYRNVKPDLQIPMYKFRSMVKDPFNPKYRLNERFMRGGFLDIPLSCEVYTPIGRILEKTQLVESPQLISVLLHNMSFVGNRPLPQANLELLKKYPDWDKRFDCPCGLTGIAQVVGKLTLTPEERLTLENLYSRVYQEGNIIKCDFYILFYTMKLLLFRQYLPYKKALDCLNSCLE